MKQLFFILAALLCLMPVQAKVDAGQLLGNLLQAVNESHQTATSPAPANAPGIGDQIMLTFRGATDSVLESYKEEGRKYAREMGDIITQRIMEDKKINSTLDSMRLFCWAVVIYLTVISLLVLYMLLRLRMLYAHLMSELKRN